MKEEWIKIPITMTTPTDLINDKSIDLNPKELRRSYALQIENVFMKKINSPISMESRHSLEEVWKEVEEFILQPK